MRLRAQMAVVLVSALRIRSRRQGQGFCICTYSSDASPFITAARLLFSIFVSSLSPLDYARGNSFDPVQTVAACTRRKIEEYSDDLNAMRARTI